MPWPPMGWDPMACTPMTWTPMARTPMRWPPMPWLPMPSPPMAWPHIECSFSVVAPQDSHNDSPFFVPPPYPMESRCLGSFAARVSFFLPQGQGTTLGTIDVAKLVVGKTYNNHIQYDASAWTPNGIFHEAKKQQSLIYRGDIIGVTS